MDENEHVCAWTGLPFSGKGYVIQTTDGVELVSAVAFQGRVTEPVDQDGQDDQAAPADLTKQPAA